MRCELIAAVPASILPVGIGAAGRAVSWHIATLNGHNSLSSLQCPALDPTTPLNDLLLCALLQCAAVSKIPTACLLTRGYKKTHRSDDGTREVAATVGALVQHIIPRDMVFDADLMASFDAYLSVPEDSTVLDGSVIYA